MNADGLNNTGIVKSILRFNQKFLVTSKNGQFLAIAGRRGFAHFNVLSNKWKLFGNEHQV